MASLEVHAFRDVRASIVSKWNVINLYNAAGEVVYTRTGLNNGRAKWTHKTEIEVITIGTDVNGNPITSSQVVQSNPDMQMTINISGADLTLPCEIASVELTTSQSHESNPRVKDTLDSVVKMTTRTDTFLYKMNIKVGE